MKSLKTLCRLASILSVLTTFTVCIESQAKEIRGWGTVTDPDRDCRIEEQNGVVTFTLPKTKHDLWYGGRNPATRFNSPRVLQQVTGDFVATVRVTAYWDRGIADGGYNGAGLVIWDSERQYLRLERNRMKNGSRVYTYTTPLYDHNNRRGFFVATTDNFFRGNSTWLRIKRSGAKVLTEISHDGQHWINTGVVDTEFPNVVRVGIHSVNSTGKVFTVRYDQFSITRS